MGKQNPQELGFGLWFPQLVSVSLRRRNEPRTAGSQGPLREPYGSNKSVRMRTRKYHSSSGPPFTGPCVPSGPRKQQVKQPTEARCQCARNPREALLQVLQASEPALRGTVLHFCSWEKTGFCCQASPWDH